MDTGDWERRVGRQADETPQDTMGASRDRSHGPAGIVVLAPEVPASGAYLDGTAGAALFLPFGYPQPAVPSFLSQSLYRLGAV